MRPAASAARIAADIATLSRPPYSESTQAVCRWGWTPAWTQTLLWLDDHFRALGFSVGRDPVGTFLARNVPAGEPAFGIGSHPDSTRDGGAWDGMLGLVCALELARVAAERGLELPLAVIGFTEEEGSRWGEVLLGSRIMTGDIAAPELEELRDAQGVSFAHAARTAGFRPQDAGESARALGGLTGWLEIHIEQARRLEAAALPLGVVTAIAGVLHADVIFTGRADHAGATPMDLRRDALAAAACCAVDLERRARASEGTVVATVGELSIDPGQRTTIPARAWLGIDCRSTTGAHIALAEAVHAAAVSDCGRRGIGVTWREVQRRPAQSLNAGLVARAQAAANGLGLQPLLMHSGAVHDTMLLAPQVPSVMLFVPCRDGRSHTPAEHADPAHAALAVDVAIDVALMTMAIETSPLR